MGPKFKVEFNTGYTGKENTEYFYFSEHPDEETLRVFFGEWLIKKGYSKYDPDAYFIISLM